MSTIEASAFADCISLNEIVVPDNISSLGEEAFSGCTSLSNATIGKSVSIINTKLFSGCTALTTVYCKRVEPPLLLEENSFAVYSDAVLYVPTQSVQTYQNAVNWELFGLILGMDFSDKYDVNDDGEVNIADINAIIDAILTGSMISKADVNRDGEVNIADINAIIDAILSQ